MALSTCPKCAATNFEVKQAAPMGSNFYLWFVQCSSCGTVVASHEANNIGALLADQEKLLHNVHSAVKSLQIAVEQLGHQVDRLGNR